MTDIGMSALLAHGKTGFLICQHFYPVSLDVLLHVVPLDKSPEITKVLRQKTLLRFEISFIIGCLHCKVNFPDYFDIFTFFSSFVAKLTKQSFFLHFDRWTITNIIK